MSPKPHHRPLGQPDSSRAHENDESVHSSPGGRSRATLLASSPPSRPDSTRKLQRAATTNLLSPTHMSNHVGSLQSLGSSRNHLPDQLSTLRKGSSRTLDGTQSVGEEDETPVMSITQVSHQPQIKI